MTDEQVGDMDFEHAKIVQVDVLDATSIVVSFSNGVSAKLDSAMVKQLAITSATEMVRQVDEED